MTSPAGRSVKRTGEWVELCSKELLLLEFDDTRPFACRSVSAQFGDAFEVELRRAILGFRFQGAPEGGFRLFEGFSLEAFQSFGEKLAPHLRFRGFVQFADEFVNVHGFLKALQAEESQPSRHKLSGNVAMGVAGDKRVCAEILIQTLHARGEVDICAHGIVAELLGTPEVADISDASVQADASAEDGGGIPKGEASHLIAQQQGTPAGAELMIRL